ncbi:MAG: DUF1801 domain-containing protein [Coxiellaceae bacterium]|nr:DUF1801 domain-containing protein [Coxiellaceae bacterium]
MSQYKKFKSDEVKERFNTYPKHIKKKILFLRQLIFDVASCTSGVGHLEETLKWGEPSYVTSQTKSGSTVRIDWKKSMPNQYVMYFNCKTTLVETFREMYGDLFTYGGNRSLIFQIDDKVPVDELSDCIAIALTYHTKNNLGEKP